MNRLIQKGLMFGNLIPVASPVLVERYNRALKHLTGKTTSLREFHIDMAGFSPEIGDELNDPLYLNHAGVNRQFILLTTEQKTAPLLNAKFSTSRSILRHFIEENEAQLFALTARDAVAGELVNAVYAADTPARLFDIRNVTVEADTTEGTLRDAAELGALVDRFMTRDDAWFDDVLIADMIGVAQRTGDIARNPVLLKEMSFKQGNLWTAHFGGLYIFRDLEHPALIAASDTPLGAVPIRHVFTLEQRNQIAKFLELNKLAEPIITARGIDGAAILRQKMDFIVIAIAAELGLDITGASRRDIRRLARIAGDRLPPEYHGLRQLVAWAEDDAPWPRIPADHPAYFYALRAADHDDADLVNMLLSQLAPRDVRQLFICHKDLFYARYATWPNTKKEYVAEFLATEYQVDKAGTRAALFGHEAPMATPAPPPKPRDTLIERVGPWGALKRR